MKKGFTLVELLVVIGIFGSLMLAGSTFLIAVIKNANRTRIENELRQTASRIMLDITSEIRREKATATFNATTGRLTVINPTGTITYFASSDGSFSKTTASGTIYFTRKDYGVAGVLSAAYCNFSSATIGLNVSPESIDVNNPAVVTLTVQAPRHSTIGFCPQVILKDTLVPRQY